MRIRNELFDVLLELLDVLFPPAELRDPAKDVGVGRFVVIRNSAKFVVVENDDFVARLERLVRVRRYSVSEYTRGSNKCKGCPEKKTCLCAIKKLLKSCYAA